MKKLLIYGSLAAAGVLAILLFSSSSMAVPAKRSFEPPESDPDTPPEQASSSSNVNKLLIPDVKLDRLDSIDLSYSPQTDSYENPYLSLGKEQVTLDKLRTL